LNVLTQRAAGQRAALLRSIERAMGCDQLAAEIHPRDVLATQTTSPLDCDGTSVYTTRDRAASAAPAATSGGQR
jgi:hypothetical protein